MHTHTHTYTHTHNVKEAATGACSDILSVTYNQDRKQRRWQQMYELTKDKPYRKKRVNMTVKPVRMIISVDVMMTVMITEATKMKAA